MTSSEVDRASDGSTSSSPEPEVVLRVRGVSKKFPYSLRDALRYGAKRLLREFMGLPSKTESLEPGEFWAVRDVSFELNRGETLGVIGRNGAGKSTLLKIINGVLLPDWGQVAIKGAVGGLIEVGAGFQPNLTGRENIYIVGSILGMSRERIDSLFNDIVSFADIGEFIDSPVQSYSSGMIVRLGFAIHVFQQPDVLLADEILSVGDFEFQQKCLAKVSQVKRSLALILVTHSLTTIVRFCDRAIVMDQGAIVFDGAPEEAVLYMTSMPARVSGSHRRVYPNSDSSKGANQEFLSDEIGFQDDEYVELSSGQFALKSLFGPEYCNRGKISDVWWQWSFDGEDLGSDASFLGSARFSFSFRLNSPGADLAIGITIFSVEGQMLTAFNTDSLGVAIQTDADGTVSGALVIERLSLNPGEYVPCFTIVTKGAEYMLRKVLRPIRVVRRPQENQAHSLLFGVYTEEYRWEVSDS